MERLPVELSLRIFHRLDHRSLAAARRVCRIWKVVASDDTLWLNLFKERWGRERAKSYDLNDSKSWKDAYIVQDRCDRFGLTLPDSFDTALLSQRGKDHQGRKRLLSHSSGRNPKVSRHRPGDYERWN